MSHSVSPLPMTSGPAEWLENLGPFQQNQNWSHTLHTFLEWSVALQEATCACWLLAPLLQTSPIHRPPHQGPLASQPHPQSQSSRSMATSSRLCRAMAFSSGPLRLSSAAVRSAGAMRFQPAVHGPAFSRNFRCDFSGWCTGADQYPCKVRRCLPAQLNIDLQGRHYWSHACSTVLNACSTVLMTVWYSCCMNGLHAHDTYTLHTSPFGASQLTSWAMHSHVPVVP